MTARSRDARRLTYLLSQRTGRHIGVNWDASRSVWSVEWNNGPGVEEMRQLVGELAHQVPGVDVEALRFARIPDSPRAWAVQLVRHVRAGGKLLPLEPLSARLGLGWGQTTRAEDARMRFELEHVEQPWADRPVDDEEQRLADALLRATPIPGDMWELLAAHGLAALGGEGALPEGVVPLHRPKRAQEGL
jgi:hypothetical protein